MKAVSEGMGGLAKGLAIIEALATQGVLSVADAARSSNITRAAARRCLITLTELGYVEHSGREFRATPRLRRLGGASTPRDRIARLAEPLLQRARDELAELVSLAVLDDDRPLFIARAEAEHILSTGVRVGAHLPAYCCDGPRLLSQFEDSEIARRIGRKPFPARDAAHHHQTGAVVGGNPDGAEARLCDQRPGAGARHAGARGARDRRQPRDRRRDQRQRGVGAVAPPTCATISCRYCRPAPKRSAKRSAAAGDVAQTTISPAAIAHVKIDALGIPK